METPNTTPQPIVLATPPTPAWFYYLLSFLVFPIGWFLGVIYFRKFGPENKNFAMTCTLLGLALPALLIILFVVSFVLRKV